MTPYKIASCLLEQAWTYKYEEKEGLIRPWKNPEHKEQYPNTGTLVRRGYVNRSRSCAQIDEMPRDSPHYNPTILLVSCIGIHIHTTSTVLLLFVRTDVNPDHDGCKSRKQSRQLDS
jgi:hypothetical protein